MPHHRAARFVIVFAFATAMTLCESAALGAWGPATGLSNLPNRYEVDVNLAIDGAGGVHAAFQDFHDYDCKYYYTYNFTGTWSANELIGTAGGKGSIPLLAVTPDNVIHVFYGKNNLYWRYKPVIGGSWSTPVEVAVNPTGGNFANHVVVDSDGGMYFMWGHLFDDSAPIRNGIYGRYKPLGGNWGATELIAGGTNDGKWHKGEFLFADGTTLWALVNYGGDTYLKKRVPGNPWTGGTGAGTFVHRGGSGRFVRNPINPGEIAFGFAEDVDGNANGLWWEVFVCYTYDGGNTFTTPYNVSNKTALDRNVNIAYDAAGGLHVAWEGADCDGCKLRMYTRSKINGVWGSRQALTSSSYGTGLCANGLKASGNTIHLGFSMETNWWDSYHMANVQAPPPATPPLVYPITLSHDPLIADDTIQHTLTMQASDINGIDDLEAMRWLINLEGDHAGQHRGYVAWGKTAADIYKYETAADWSIAAADSGAGYWGIYLPGYGSTQYLTIHSVAESTFGAQRTVEFTFSVKPRFYADGPLTGNDISAWADDAASNTGWVNNDLDFAIQQFNHDPIVDVMISDPMLMPDNSSLYQITVSADDNNGRADIRAARALINYQGDNAGLHRGYLAWGLTDDDIWHWDGYASWTTWAVNSGAGRWGIHNAYGGQTYIWPVSATESGSGNNRTVTFTIKALPAWFTDGPLDDNDISGFVEDTYTYVGWLNNDLNFRIYPLQLDAPDFDRDTDVDMEDFGHMQACITGPQEPVIDPNCGNALLDNDTDIDAADVALFENCFSGPGNQASGTCMP